MIKLEATSRNLPADMYYIKSGDIEFDVTLSRAPCKLDTIARQYMQEIDNAEILDERIGTVKTKLGVTDLTHLSTGLKVLLLTHYYKQQHRVFAINLNECGPNVLSHIFKELDGSSCIGVLYHVQFDSDILLKFTCYIGGVLVDSEGSLLAEIMKQRKV